MVYSFVTSLTQEIDWAACQKACYIALGYPTFEHAVTNKKLNRSIYIPGGEYMFGADTLLIRNCVGANIYGDGRLSTTLKANDTVFATDGFWYSQVTGISFECTTTCTSVVDIDGNVPGQPYATRGVQANTFKDCHFNGVGLASHSLAITRLGSSAQGSENLFLNCHFDNSTTASFLSNGFNALQNSIIGGNFQGHQKHGIQIIAGSVNVFSVGFQSTYGYTQILNDGYDVDASSAGVSERIVIIGCRSESLRFYRGAISQSPVLIGNYNLGYGSDVGWSATTAYTLNQSAIKTSATLGPKLYVVTTAGTSAGSEPTWPDSGTVADGSVVWTQTNYLSVDTVYATMVSNEWAPSSGIKVFSWKNDGPITTNTATALSVRRFETPSQVIFADTTSGNQTITLVRDATIEIPDGATITIKKVTTDANTVTLAYSGGNGGEAVTLPGGATGFVTLRYSVNAGVTNKWWIVG